MGRRFADHERIEELKIEKDAIDAWRAKSREQKKQLYTTQIGLTGGKRTNRGNKLAYLMPFSFDAAKKLYVPIHIPIPSGSPPTQGEENDDALITALTGKTKDYFKETLTTGETGMPISPNALARKVAQVTYTKIGTSTPNIKSRITGRPYTHVKSNSVSCPFGSNGTLTEPATKAALIAALKTADDIRLRFRGESL